MRLPWLSCLALLMGLAWDTGGLLVMADDHQDHKRKKHHGPVRAVPVNSLHQQSCGGCHLAYPPGLLPARSWRKLVEEQAQHFGEDLGLDQARKRELKAYLEAYASDASWGKLGRKMMRGLGSDVPLRITETPYILKKHRGRHLPPGALQRKTVGSLANCGACHPGAARGDFDDDAVRVPPE